MLPCETSAMEVESVANISDQCFSWGSLAKENAETFSRFGGGEGGLAQDLDYLCN
jgi:hypothetical protein